MLGRGVRGPAGLFHLLFGRPGPEIAPKNPYFAMSISVDIAHSMSLDISVDIDVDDMSTPDILRVNPVPHPHEDQSNALHRPNPGLHTGQVCKCHSPDRCESDAWPPHWLCIGIQGARSGTPGFD